MGRKAVILAGGLGTRLKPFTEVIPKPLLPIGEKAVLEIQIEHLKHYGFDEIIVATNYKSEYIENFLGDGSRYGVKVTVSKEAKPLGTAGPLTLIKAILNEPFIVVNGDILSLIDLGKFYNFALEKNTLLTVAIKEIITPYDFGNIFFDNDFVTGIQEKPNFTTYALAGIYAMQPDIFNIIPEDSFFCMDELIIKMLNNKLQIAKYKMEEYWLDIGSIDNFEEAQEIYKKHFRE